MTNDTYTITLPDGTTIEAPSMVDTCRMYHGVAEPEPTATLGTTEYTLQDYIDCYERKATSDNYTPEQRAIYTDVAEKLQVLQNAGELTESL